MFSVGQGLRQGMTKARLGLPRKLLNTIDPTICDELVPAQEYSLWNVSGDLNFWIAQEMHTKRSVVRNVDNIHTSRNRPDRLVLD